MMSFVLDYTAMVGEVDSARVMIERIKPLLGGRTRCTASVPW
jgi:hypothetical protein